MMKLRPYQQEIISKINSIVLGNYLVQLFTAGGKTVIFTHLINNYFKKALIISHREELVNQPLKYLTKSYSIEKGDKKADLSKDVISASIQSLYKRYKNYDKHMFDVIIWDECHHLAANTYTEVFNYFKPKFNLGFTATPNRNDDKSLEKYFSEIIYEKNLLWGIENNYLSNIKCKRCYINYDIKKIKKSNGDYQIKSLEENLLDHENSKAIADIYYKHAIGATLIFAVSVKHAEEISKHIKNSVIITAKTKNRQNIINDFTNKKIKCIINVAIFTEGTDIPLIQTIIMARPTKNVSLYQQIIGRGIRLHKNKKELLLIDCVGVSNNLELCTAPTLLGIEYNDEKIKKEDKEIECNLFDLPKVIEEKTNTIDNWKINWKYVNLWSKRQGYNTHNVNWYKHSDGSFSLNLPNKINIKTSPINSLGMLEYKDRYYKTQEFFDIAYMTLNKKYQKYRYIWDLKIIKSWAYKMASEKQINLIKKLLPNEKIGHLNKLEASQILNKLLNK